MNESSDCTEYDTDDEEFSDPIPVNLYQEPGQNATDGQLPLCSLFNARSVYNKADNLTELLSQICPDICMISESWESERRRLNKILNSTQYKYTSCYRKNRAPGGGCAILYNETRFSVTELDIEAQEGVESFWDLFTPKSDGFQNLKVKRSAVGSFYISPKSRYKAETIEHIIQNINTLKA